MLENIVVFLTQEMFMSTDGVTVHSIDSSYYSSIKGYNEYVI